MSSSDAAAFARVKRSFSASASSRAHAACARASALALACALVACTTSTASSSLSPITGIVVPASTLAGASGCGADAGALYKYAALVDAYVTPDGGTGTFETFGVAKGVYDCFVDALFLAGSGTALPLGADGTGRFCVEVVGLEASDYAAAKGPVDDLGNASTPVDVSRFRALTGARYECTATVRQNVTSQAACVPSTHPCQQQP